jgi:hypothetical protein
MKRFKSKVKKNKHFKKINTRRALRFTLKKYWFNPINKYNLYKIWLNRKGLCCIWNLPDKVFTTATYYKMAVFFELSFDLVGVLDIMVLLVYKRDLWVVLRFTDRSSSVKFCWAKYCGGMLAEILYGLAFRRAFFWQNKLNKYNSYTNIHRGEILTGGFFYALTIPQPYTYHTYKPLLKLYVLFIW